MEHSTYKLSRMAQRHLTNIKSYTVQQFSEQQWHRYKETLLSGFQMLADNPNLGRGCSDLYPNGFYFPVGKHMTYFTKENDFILVVAVLGQSQIPQKHLK